MSGCCDNGCVANAGFEIQLDYRIIVNLGDTLLREKEWQAISNSE